MIKAKKRIIKFISIVIVFLIVQNLFSWALKPINYSHWVNRDIKIYKKDVNTLVLGSSHIFCGFDPELFDEKTNCVSFNLGSASQGIKDSYYYMLNCYRQFSGIKNVIIDVYFASLIKKTHSEGENLQRRIILLDRLNDPLTKFQYIFNSFDVDEMPMAFFNSIYYNNRKDLIINNIKSKLTPEYRHYELDNVGIPEPYKVRGFIPYDCTVKSSLALPKGTELNFNIDSEGLKYLSKIISFCNKKAINLMFIQMPISELANSSVVSYRQFFGKVIEKISKENSIPYIDLNEKEYGFSDDIHFTSSEHLNIKGAEFATELCADFFNKSINISK